MKTPLRLIGFLTPYLGWVFLSVFLGSATITSAIGLLGTSAYLISAAALHPSIAALQVAIVGVRFFSITRGIFRYLERLSSHSVNFRLLREIRVWLYQQLEPLAPAQLSLERSGDLLGRMMGDIENLEDFFVRVVAPPIVAIIVTVGVISFLVIFDVSIAAIVLIGLLLTGFLIPFLTYFANRETNQRLNLQKAALSTAWVDSVQGLPELVLFGKGNEQAAKVEAINQELTTLQKRASWISALSNSAGLFIANLTMLAAIVVAIPLVTRGMIAGENLATIALISLTSFEAVFALGPAGLRLENSLESARRLFQIADRRPAITEPELSQLVCSDDISVQHLSFSYQEDRGPVLNDISFDLPAGKRIAVVGVSGSGKTSILNLLLRFWDYSEGKILLGENEIRNISSSKVREHFGVISQSTYLFSTTVSANLRLAKPGATHEEMLDALTKADLLEWVSSLPDGLETWLGDQGVRMSGGERQRLAIAQIILQNAPIALLDEPTSHLDSQTEHRLLQTILEVTRGKSMIWVTHHLTMLNEMDEILVMDKGKIIERGRHMELLAIGGKYASLWRHQESHVID